jgi:hypothetical protein
MKTLRVVVAGLLTIPLLVWTLGLAADRAVAQDGRREAVGAEKLAITDRASTNLHRAQETAALERVLRDSPAFAKLQFDAAAIQDGRIVAVEGDNSSLITADNLQEKLRAGVVFVDHDARARVTRAHLPTSLEFRVQVDGEAAEAEAEEGEVAAFKLAYQVIPEATADRPLRLDTWVRDSTGLLVDGPRSVFSGAFHVALTNAEDENDRAALGSPVVLAVHAPGASEIAPNPLAIDRLASWHEVLLTVPVVLGDTYSVAVSADPQREVEAVPLAVRRPTVRLWSEPSSIEGWGIGQSTIQVAVTGLRSPRGTRVPLKSLRGALEAPHVTLDDAGQAAVRLRSSRAPRTTVSVPSAMLVGEPLEVPFEAPWAFLTLALAGGLVGALLKGRGRDRWPIALVIGIASALVMTLAHAVGLNWPARVLQEQGLTWAGEALVFVLGAVGALVGVSVLVSEPES